MLNYHLPNLTRKLKIRILHWVIYSFFCHRFPEIRPVLSHLSRFPCHRTVARDSFISCSLLRSRHSRNKTLDFSICRSPIAFYLICTTCSIVVYLYLAISYSFRRIVNGEADLPPPWPPANSSYVFPPPKFMFRSSRLISPRAVDISLTIVSNSLSYTAKSLLTCALVLPCVFTRRKTSLAS